MVIRKWDWVQEFDGVFRITQKDEPGMTITVRTQEQAEKIVVALNEAYRLGRSDERMEDPEWL